MVQMSVEMKELKKVEPKVEMMADLSVVKRAERRAET